MTTTEKAWAKTVEFAMMDTIVHYDLTDEEALSAVLGDMSLLLIDVVEIDVNYA